MTVSICDTCGCAHFNTVDQHHCSSCHRALTRVTIMSAVESLRRLANTSIILQPHQAEQLAAMLVSGTGPISIHLNHPVMIVDEIATLPRINYGDMLSVFGRLKPSFDGFANSALRGIAEHIAPGVDLFEPYPTPRVPHLKRYRGRVYGSDRKKEWWNR